MNILLKLNPGIGEDLGPDFLITCDVIGWSETATDIELYAGISIVVPDEATVIYIQSLGICLNILTIPIEPFVCTLEVEMITTTTTTSSTSTTSTTTSTTIAIPDCQLEGEGEVITTTTTSSSSTSTTTSTSSSTTTTTTTINPIAECLAGLTIETITLYEVDDVKYINPEYILPENFVFGHNCNRAFYEIFANGIWVGDSLMNNKGGSTACSPTGDDNCVQSDNSGRWICGDYLNKPTGTPLCTGIWGGSTYARYSSITLTGSQAMAIAETLSGSTLSFNLISPMSSRTIKCSGVYTPHQEVTWIRITNEDNVELYNDAPIDFIATINLCEIPSTCVRPSGMISKELVLSINGINCTNTLAAAQSAISVSVPSSHTNLNVSMTAWLKGKRMYSGNDTSCTYVPDGFYPTWTNGKAANYIYEVKNGIMIYAHGIL